MRAGVETHLYAKQAESTESLWGGGHQLSCHMSAAPALLPQAPLFVEESVPYSMQTASKGGAAVPRGLPRFNAPTDKLQPH